MKKRSLISYVVLFLMFIGTCKNVKGDETVVVYSVGYYSSEKMVIEERIPFGTVVIGNHGYSLQQMNQKKMKSIAREAEHVYVKLNAEKWIDHKTKKEVSMDVIPEIQYTDRYANTLFYEKSDGPLIEDKSLEALIVINIDGQDKIIGNEIDSFISDKFKELFANAEYFSIESPNGEKQSKLMTLNTFRFIYTKVDKLSVEGKVNIILHNFREEKVAKFKDIKVKENRIVITDKDEVGE